MGAALADRVRRALSEPIAADEVVALVGEMQIARDTASTRRAEAHKRALDPSLTASEAEKAHAESVRLQFEVERLEAGIVALEGRERVLRDSERGQAKAREYAAAKQERDDLAKALKERWPALASEMVELLGRLKASDARLVKVNPGHTGDEWLQSAEVVARGLATAPGTGMSTDTSLAASKIVSFDPRAGSIHDYGLAWPTSTLKVVA